MVRELPQRQRERPFDGALAAFGPDGKSENSFLPATTSQQTHISGGTARRNHEVYPP